MGNANCICNRSENNNSELPMRNTFYLSNDEEFDKNLSVIQKKHRSRLARRTVVDNLEQAVSAKITVRLREEEFNDLIPQNIKSLLLKVSNENKINNVSKVKVIKLQQAKLLASDYYSGEWNLKGEKHGFGTYISKDKDSVYHGIFKNNKFDGYGLYAKTTGEYYIGQWKEGQIHGKGALVQSDNTIYTGDWNNNFRCGIGKETTADGSTYVGSFLDNEKDGHGVFTWKDGLEYSGNFINSNIHGQGKMIWPDGKTYEGSFSNGKIDGQGTTKWSNKHIYIGHYKNDIKSGNGKYIWANGNTFEGQWVNNKPHGKCSFNNGKNILSGVWRFGRLINLTSESENDNSLNIKEDNVNDRKNNEIRNINEQLSKIKS